MSLKREHSNYYIILYYIIVMLEHLQSVMELFFIKCTLLLCRTTIITILIIFWAAKNIHFSICLWGTGWFRMGKSQTQSKRINITCILLIPTTSDRWMKAFRKSTYPCDGPNSIDLHPSLWMSALFYFFFILNPSPLWLLPHPECRFIYNLYNNVLYKIEKSSFTKDSLAKERNIKSEF